MEVSVEHHDGVRQDEDRVTRAEQLADQVRIALPVSGGECLETVMMMMMMMAIACDDDDDDGDDDVNADDDDGYCW